MTDTLVARAADNYSSEVLTYQDFVDRLLDGPFGQLERDGRNMRLARRAVLRAYRDLPGFHPWNYLQRRGQLTTVAQQTSTLTYDHTGGASERLVTLADAIFPTDAQYYSLLVGTRIYRIHKYLSTTTAQLREDTNPGADVASGTACTLYRAIYPAPVGLRRVSDFVDLTNGDVITGISNAMMVNFLISSYTPQTELCFTVRNTGSTIGGIDFEFAPPPSDETTYEYAYESIGRPLRVERELRGSVTVSSGSTTVTGTGTQFGNLHIGSIIRFSDNSQANSPSPDEGNIEIDNPYVAQRTITAVASTTSLTIDSAISSATTYTDVKYVISDPLDVDASSMLSSLERLALAYYAEDLDVRPTQERTNWMRLFHQDLVRAKIADNQMQGDSTWLADRRLYNLRDWLIAEAG